MFYWPKFLWMLAVLSWYLDVHDCRWNDAQSILVFLSSCFMLFICCSKPRFKVVFVFGKCCCSYVPWDNLLRLNCLLTIRWNFLSKAFTYFIVICKIPNEFIVILNQISFIPFLKWAFFSSLNRKVFIAAGDKFMMFVAILLPKFFCWKH